jgi:glyoxylase-like metal-dependent hydrolase (beta-lactamase superfamily II)
MTIEPTYTITPVNAGIIHDSEWSNLTLKRHIGEKISVPTIIWVVRGGGRTIIVDTGPGDETFVKTLVGRTLDRVVQPEDAFLKLGVDPSQVKTVVISHLHWDHSGGLNMFPNAEIIIQRSELQWAIAPLPFQSSLYEWQRPDGELPRWLGARRRMRIIDGDLEIAPGLKLVHLPGHTPGCMGLCCNTTGGRHLIACDAVPTFENFEEEVPPGWYVNIEDTYRTAAKIPTIADVVLPGHDMRVFEKTEYP